MEKSKLIKKIDNQIYFRIFLALLWTKEILLNYLRGILLKIPGLSVASDYIIPVILFLMFLLSYKTIAERLMGEDFIFVMGCVLVYVANFLFFKRNRDFFRIEWVEFIIGALPFYFVGVALKKDDGDSVMLLLYRISCVSVISFCAYILFVNRMDDFTMRNGDMNSAYNILPHACMIFYYMIKGFKWHRLVIFLMSALALLMMGTRGAVLCLLIFIVLSSAMTIRFKRPVVLLVMVVVCLLFVLFHGLTDWLIELAYSICESLGLSTRVFDKLMSGDFAVSGSRTYLRERVRYYLAAYPLIGLGVYGDRAVSGGQYVHNLLLEIYGQHGVLIGTVMIAALAVIFYRGVRTVFRNGDRNAQLIVLLLVSYCFKLLVSSSYLREPFFWLLLGYLVAIHRECRVANMANRESMKKSKLIR